MNPCKDWCYARFGKEYTPECDKHCDYAKLHIELKQLREENEKLHDLWSDASIRLEDEQAENKKLLEMYQKEKAVCHATQTELEQVKRERDAAVEQLHGYCPACKNYTPNHNEGACAECKHEYFQYQNIDARDNWEWCGIKED